MDMLLEYKEKISAKLERYDKCSRGVLLFVAGGEELVVGLVGFIYPAYVSFKAINTPGTVDDTQWLTYWVIYAFFNLTESITNLLLSWIPFYFFLKIAFLVWSYHPRLQVIYNSLIKPYVAPHVGQIDSALNRGEDAAKNVSAKLQDKSQ
ncbi:unnamed protein product [Peronospora destructor]|uniref:Receptor expression-enhancing protein n=1 Tax=Peronospora destructor TaxID=86335 RepID=A0AAV0T400_9STRA|nr:unnamed protein product [Peronospora destructor]